MLHQRGCCGTGTGNKYIWPSVGLKYTLDSMRLFTINKRVSRTSNWTSLYLTVNFILLLREFNQSVNFSRDGTLSNQILRQSSRNVDNRVKTEHRLACY